MSFTESSIFRFAKNIISISSQLAAGSPNAQFGKTQFFETLSIKQTTFYEQFVLDTLYKKTIFYEH